MGGMEMTTPIMNVLDTLKQPPFFVEQDGLELFVRNITALYEQQTKEDREAFLLDDFMTLYFHGNLMIKINRQKLSENDQKLIKESIDVIAWILLQVANGLNTRLPESFINQLRNSTKVDSIRFYNIIKEAYAPPAWQEKQTPSLPEELDNEYFRQILNRGIKAGIIIMEGGKYNWQRTNYLLAYFAIRVTKILNLKKKDDAIASYRPFEILFGLKENSLKGCPNDWAKGKGKDHKNFRPNGWEKIEALLNENVK